MKKFKKNVIDSVNGVSESEVFSDYNAQEDKSFFREHFDMICIIFGVFILICAICVTVSIIDMNKSEIRYLNDRITYLEQKIYDK